jgi:hypothetical protein
MGRKWNCRAHLVCRKWCNGLSSGGSIYVYDTQGALISSSDKIADLYEFAWIQDGTQDYIALITDVQGGMKWELLNPSTGKTFPLTGTPELYSVTEPNGLSVYPMQLAPMSNWAVVNYDSAKPQPMSIPFKLNVRDVSDALTISDDGTELAFISDNQVIVTDLKNSYVASSGVKVEAIVWSPTAWRIQQVAP